MKAVAKCNRSAHLRIVPVPIQLSVAVGAKKIDMTVELQDSHGREPNENLSDTDFHETESRFRKALDSELKVAGIPLTLGTVLVPSGYWGK